MLVSTSFVVGLSVASLLLNLAFGYLAGSTAKESLMTYYGCGTILYFMHYVGHKRWIPWWYLSHVFGHHRQSYPPERFTSDTYVVNTYDVYGIGTWIYVLPAALYACAMRSWSVWWHLCMIMLLNNYLHAQIHLTHSWWSKSVWFQQLQHLHKNHHKFPCNYAVHDFTLDVLFGKFKF